ncbi:MAG TPA: SpoIIE family protein phosphatase [Acidimicrobiales bacterium]|nr:SpoIIE family protein phosphatase [Acidimicrobiales bacterium]
MTSEHEAELDALAGELLDCYEELTILYGLSAALANVFEEDALASIAIEHATKATGAASGLVALVDGTRVVMSGTGHDLDPRAAIGRVALGVEGPMLFDPGSTRGDHAPGGALSPQAALVTPVPGPDGTPLGALVLAGDDADRRFDARSMKLAAAVASQLGVALHASRLLVSLQEVARMQQELEIAASIQRGLLPRHPPEVPGIEVAGRCIAAAQVGGDLFDHLVGDDGRLTVVVADVAGHSISSALLMATTRSLLRREIQEGRGPAEALAAAGGSLYEDLAGAGLFVTVFCAQLAPSTGELRFANGAHNPALLRRSDGTVEELDADGMALGMVDGWPYDEGVRTLAPGDLVVLYTDGVTEARDGDGELFGEARLHALVADLCTTSAEEAADAIVGAAMAFSGDAGLQDDLTVLVLEVRS